MTSLRDQVNNALDSLHLKRAIRHYEDACQMADLLTSFGIEANGAPIEVIDGDETVLTYGVLITEDSFETLKLLLLTQMQHLKGELNATTVG